MNALIKTEKRVDFDAVLSTIIPENG